MRNMNTIINEENSNLREVKDWKQRIVGAFEKYSKKCENTKNKISDKLDSKMRLTGRTVSNKKTHKELSK